MIKIIQHIFMSGIEKLNIGNIAGMNISCIINLSEIQLNSCNDVALINYYIKNSIFEDIISHFEYLFNVIDYAIFDGKNIAICCKNGSDVAPVVIIGFLIKHNKMSVKDAYELVLSKKKDININIGFFSALIWLDMQNRLVTMKLHEYMGVTRDECSEYVKKKYGIICEECNIINIKSNEKCYKCGFDL